MSFTFIRQKNFLLYGLLIVTFLLLLSRPVISAETRDVVINEIAWMGTEASYYDEWIELYNKTGETIDLSSWSIYGADSGECLDFPDESEEASTKVGPHEYLILGTNSDNVNDQSGESLVDIVASFTLSNSSSGQVILYDSSGCEGKEIDTANQSDGDWFAGNNDSKKTMERVSPCEPGTDADNWATNDPEAKHTGQDADGGPINGTPKATNSAFQDTEPTAEFTAPETVRAGEEFQVNGSSSEDCEGNISSYSWDLDGDGNYDDASGKTAAHTADEAGEIDVGLKVEDDYGKTDSTTQTVTVDGETNQPPEADPGGDYSCSPEGTITLDGSGSTDPDGTIESYEWDYDGDGTYDDATGVKPNYSCGSIGTYEIGLKVTDNAGDSDTAKATIEVTEDLRSDFSYTPQKPVAGEEIQFTGESSSFEGSITSRKWDFDDGSDSNAKNPAHVFSEAGTYTVTLTVTADSGEEDSYSKEVNVKSPVSVDAGASKTITLGESVELSGSTSTKVNGEEVNPSWKVSDKPGGGKAHMSNSNTLDPLFVPDTTGKYELKLVGSDTSGNRASDKTTITVEENPKVDGDDLAAEVVSENNKTFEKQEELSLEARIKNFPESARGSVIAYELESWPEFDVDGRLPASFRDLKVTRLGEGTVEVRFYYDEGELPQALVEESLKLFYHLPDKGWQVPEDYSVHPDGNYVYGEIPVTDLKGTPLTLAGKQGPIEGEDLIVHGPNPVPEAGCIFWLNLPEGVDGAKLKIYDSAGKPVFEEMLASDQKRFPEVGRWKPVDKYGNRLDDGLYFYRVQLVNSEEVSWSDVKKLVIGG